MIRKQSLLRTELRAADAFSVFTHFKRNTIFKYLIFCKRGRENEK